MKIYFLGIGGTAMGNLAILMQSLGHDVCGSDRKIYPPMSDLLVQHGIYFFEEYNPKNLENFAPDLIVIGNVISRGNEEVEWILNHRKIPYCSLPEIIRKNIIGGRDAIVVTGTHGKTTTTSLITYLLSINDCNPGYLIGGAPFNFPSGTCYGGSDTPFVIEGDEYDSAFFDKRSKFIHYTPKILVINNIELDHVDIFRDMEDIQRTFSHVIKLVPSSGYIIANGDAANVRQLLPVPWTKTIFVGKDDSNDFRITDEQFTSQGTYFTLKGDGNQWQIKSPLVGRHNMYNAAMAIVAARYHVGGNLKVDWRNFKGVRKRQEVIFNNAHTVIIEDFAHHPTAITETIRAVKQAFPEHRLITTFEPRSNSACSAYFQETFVEAFRGSDEVYIAEVFKKCNESLDIRKLTNDIHYCPAQPVDISTIKISFPRKINCSKQVFLFLSNGNFSDVAQHLKVAASL
ncbi:MAG: Mur ligase domain-containing protein [Puniceicoccales bacterium]|jgi:UDP-N-acetylmuramate: L-alanyl-gamma-D-glutamyl-meso-diaminopimelate ligase|nr:Mur ligase domain-containing protein [Puniceicoccales bacterium]